MNIEWNNGWASWAAMGCYWEDYVADQIRQPTLSYKDKQPERINFKKTISLFSATFLNNTK